MITQVPVIDLFAGCGGLSEGFHQFRRWSGAPIHFDIRLSIERDEAACASLRLRSFFRRFPDGGAPQAYYNYVRAGTEKERASWMSRLQELREWQDACDEVRQAELGTEAASLFDLVAWVNQAKGKSDHWILLGGPPCQAYSVIGRSRRIGNGAKADSDSLDRQRIEKKFFGLEMHRLYREYIGLLAILQPTVFIMENVAGILSSKDPSSVAAGAPERIFPRILNDLGAPWEALEKDSSESAQSLRSIAPKRRYRYRIVPVVDYSDVQGDRRYLVRSELHGLPQERHRVILMGIREDVEATPDILRPRSVLGPTVREVIGSMPPVRSGVSGFPESLQSKGSLSLLQDALSAQLGELPGLDQHLVGELQKHLDGYFDRPRGGSFLAGRDDDTGEGSELQRWFRDGRLGGVTQHFARSHMRSDLLRYGFAAEFARRNGRSPKLHEWPTTLLPNHRNLQAQVGSVAKPDFNDRFRVQVADRPATTITSHIAKDGHYFIHYDPAQMRSLTVREAARLQTFPDNFHFAGGRTEQFRQIGNAVPPLLAVQIAGVVASVLGQVQGAREAA